MFQFNRFRFRLGGRLLVELLVQLHALFPGSRGDIVLHCSGELIEIVLFRRCILIRFGSETRRFRLALFAFIEIQIIDF